MRKRAIQASRFMLQMMQAPLRADTAEQEDENGSRNLPGSVECTIQLPDFESGEEGHGICTAVEVSGFPTKKTPAEKSYILALFKILVLLHFWPSEQRAVKLMRTLLNCAAQSVVADKDPIKELKQMANHLTVIDKDPDQELSQEQLNAIFTRLELEFNHDLYNSPAIPPTPAPWSTRPAGQPVLEDA
ncbi:hypothetical protein RJ641_006416 [Dillenia turbinata]|uniref:Uncharacterized protein n=1 Tax=Dillenia turbinata TaxID=194707 RepID=A0AAN8ZA25_9MAGN